MRSRITRGRPHSDQQARNSRRYERTDQQLATPHQHRNIDQRRLAGGIMFNLAASPSAGTSGNV
jgi:hypothetical protein